MLRSPWSTPVGDPNNAVLAPGPIRSEHYFFHAKLWDAVSWTAAPLHMRHRGSDSQQIGDGRWFWDPKEKQEHFPGPMPIASRLT